LLLAVQVVAVPAVLVVAIQHRELQILAVAVAAVEMQPVLQAVQV
jgi:hypothetical protein